MSGPDVLVPGSRSAPSLTATALGAVPPTDPPRVLTTAYQGLKIDFFPTLKASKSLSMDVILI